MLAHQIPKRVLVHNNRRTVVMDVEEERVTTHMPNGLAPQMDGA